MLEKKAYVIITVSIVSVICFVFIAYLLYGSNRQINTNANAYKFDNALIKSLRPNSQNTRGLESNIKVKKGWTYRWSDEFDGQEINKNYWTIQQGGDIWGNNELQYYTENRQNCRIENGKLIITGQKENYKGKQYTSARIATKGKVDFNFGRIEIKAKLPKGKGLLPAIWLMPSEDIDSKRMIHGEIDIMEMLGDNPKVIYGVAHYLKKIKAKTSCKFYYSKDLSKDFHIYALEWDKKGLKWLLDDQVYFTLDFDKTFWGEFNPFSKKYYLIMNIAIGGNWPGNVIDDKALPAEFQIDYVRYYKKSF